MKKDFDYVMMEDYKKDTESLVNQSSSIINGLQYEIKQLKILIGAMIKVCGEVRITMLDLCTIDELKIIREEDPSTQEIIFKTENNNGK